MTQILTPLLPQSPNAQTGGTIEGEPLEVDDTALAFSVVLAATTPAQRPKIMLPKLEVAAQDAEIDTEPDDPLVNSDNLPDAERLVSEISKPAQPLETVAEPEKTVDVSTSKPDPFTEPSQNVQPANVPKAPIESAHQSIVTARAPDVSTTAPAPPRAQTAVQSAVKVPTATVTQPTTEPDIKATIPTSENTGRIASAQRTESPPVTASDNYVTRPRKHVAQPAFIATTPPDVRPDVEKTIKHVAELPVNTPQAQTKLEQTHPESVRSDAKAVSEQAPQPPTVTRPEPTVANVTTPAPRKSPATPPVQNPIPDVQPSIIASTFAKAPVEPRGNRVEKAQETAPVNAPKPTDVAPTRPDLGAFAPATAAPPLPPNHRLERIEAFDPEVFAIGSDRTAPQQQITAGSAPQSAAPEQVRQIAQQMVLATPTTAPGTTEISLNPEELGRVKMSLTVNEGAMILTISAERPDTIDIMRRHIDQLAQTYRQLGFANMTFNFAGSSEQGQTRGPARANDDLVDVAATQTDDSTNPAPTLQSNGRMDLRL